MKKLLAVSLLLGLTYCSSFSNKEGGTGTDEFTLIIKSGKVIRIERFKNSGALKAQGEVKAECGGATCKEDQIAKFAPAKVKSLPKQGIWEEYIQFEQEGSTKEKPIFKSSLDATGEYVDGKKVGIWKKPDSENPSRTIAETPWVDGKKEGIAKTYDKSGNVSSETEYHEDQKNGGYWKKNNKGEWLEKGAFKDNEEEGTWNYYFTGTDGNGIKTTSNFKNGKKHGTESNFYKDGKLESQGNYTLDARTGLWKLYGPKENVIAEGNYSAKENAAESDVKYERTGIWKEYYADGKVFGTGPRKHTRTGDWKYYYNNGQLAYEGKMANEAMLESAKIYDKTGTILGDGKLFFSLVKIDEESQDLKLNYKSSIPFTYFYPSGKKRIVIRSPEDATEYSEDGKETGKGGVDPSGRKMGSWTIAGKKEYYLLDKPKPNLTATQCQ